MRLVFPYKEKDSNIFKSVKRPVATVHFWSKLINGWIAYEMLVDTGADFTILPLYRHLDLGVNIKNDCFPTKTSGVGGQVKVFFLKKKIDIKIGENKLRIPLGFLNSNNIPPLLGRERCLNLFSFTFARFITFVDTL